MSSKWAQAAIVIGLLLGLSSCHTTAPRLDYKAVAQASINMGLDIGLKDNHALYLEAARWMGTPYRGGGESRRGVDCSGMVAQIYKKVYKIQLSRSANEQLKECNRFVSRRNLREGDLLFFGSPASRKKATHVGIYLKDGKFVHASTSRGVIVSHLKETYYAKHWLRGGRME